MPRTFKCLSESEGDDDGDELFNERHLRIKKYVTLRYEIKPSKKSYDIVPFRHPSDSERHLNVAKCFAEICCTLYIIFECGYIFYVFR